MFRFCNYMKNDIVLKQTEKNIMKQIIHVLCLILICLPTYAQKKPFKTKEVYGGASADYFLPNVIFFPTFGEM